MGGAGKDEAERSVHNRSVLYDIQVGISSQRY